MSASPSNFWKTFLRLLIPAAIQSLFFNLINIIEMLMVGQLGDVSVAAVGIAGQFGFLLNITVFGATGGASVYMAQYWGANNLTAMRRTMGMNLAIGVTCALIMTLAVMLFPRQLLGLFTSDPAVAESALSILRVVGWSYLLTSISACFYAGVRSTGDTRLPMQISVAILTGMTLISFLFIFGHLGLPRLGVQGVAIGRITGAVVECAILLWILYARRQPITAPLSVYFSFDLSFFRGHIVKILYVLGNEFFWALGTNIVHAIFSHLGTSQYAAFSITNTVLGVGISLTMGAMTSASIMIGHAIGGGDGEEAYLIGKRIVIFTTISTIMIGLVLALSRHWLVSLYQIEPATRAAAADLLLVAGSLFWLRGQDAIFVVGILRSGGDVLYSALLDVLSLWLAAIPTMFLIGSVLHLPLPFVYLALFLENLVKFTGGMWRFLSKKWIHNLTTAESVLSEAV